MRPAAVAVALAVALGLGLGLGGCGEYGDGQGVLLDLRPASSSDVVAPQAAGRVAAVLERRLRALGVEDPAVSVSDGGQRFVVRVPGRLVEEAERVLGEREFRGVRDAALPVRLVVEGVAGV